MRVMIAGVGGASLGTELAKALALAGGYEICGCDISPHAYGLYDACFKETFRVSAEDYCAGVLSVCRQSGCGYLLAGGERPAVLLAREAELFERAGIRMAMNNPACVSVCSDKQKTFAALRKLGAAAPKSVVFETREDLADLDEPYIVKPTTLSGGSSLVFFAKNKDEAVLYGQRIREAGDLPLAQEYLPLEGGGEFTIGVLSLPDGSLAGSAALRRSLSAKLSTQSRLGGAVISSGYSQGHIGDYPGFRKTAEGIAAALGSTGPMNIQGRVKDGVFTPFEINARFSASTYLRALAGFNEPDIFLRHLALGERPRPAALRAGWYFRSLAERFVPDEELKR